MSDATIHHGDSFAFAVTVTDEETRGPLGLTGATITVRAGQNGVASLTATVTVAAPAAGRFVARFPPGALGLGAWIVEVVVEKDGERKTVATLTVNVLRSLSAP
jgi:hypothetical protein